MKISKTKMNWFQALEYARENDARLPTRTEVEGLDVKDRIWTSETLSKNIALAWNVIPYCGNTLYDDTFDTKLHVLILEP